MKAEHFSEPDCHIGIPREIEINLKRVSCCTKPGRCDGKRYAHGKDIVGNHRHVICNEDFLAESINEAHHAVREIVKGFVAMLDLLLDIVIAHDRTCDELREERDVESDIQDTPLSLCLVIINIEEIGEQLECEERDADGERDVDGGKIRMQQQSRFVRGKRQILENEQQADVERSASDEPVSPHLLRAPRCLADPEADKPASDDRNDHEEYEDGLAPGIEQQACGEQEAVAERPRTQPWLIVYDQHERQEDEQEDRR